MACPILKPGRGEGRIEDGEDARRVAGQLIVLDAVRADLTRAMNAWADVHGPTEVRTMKGERAAYGFERRDVTQRPTRDELEKAIRDAGGAGGLDLDRLYRKRTQTRFGLYKPEDEEEQDDELLRSLEASVEAAAEQRGAA